MAFNYLNLCHWSGCLNKLITWQDVTDRHADTAFYVLYSLARVERKWLLLRRNDNDWLMMFTWWRCRLCNTGCHLMTSPRLWPQCKMRDHWLDSLRSDSVSPRLTKCLSFHWAPMSRSAGSGVDLTWSIFVTLLMDVNKIDTLYINPKSWQDNVF